MKFSEYLDESNDSEEHKQMVDFVKKSLIKLKLKYIPYKVINDGSNIDFGTDGFDSNLPSIVFNRKTNKVEISSVSLSEKDANKLSNIISEIGKKSNDIFKILDSQEDLEYKLYNI